MFTNSGASMIIERKEIIHMSYNCNAKWTQTLTLTLDDKTLMSFCFLSFCDATTKFQEFYFVQCNAFTILKDPAVHCLSKFPIKPFQKPPQPVIRIHCPEH